MVLPKDSGRAGNWPSATSAPENGRRAIKAFTYKMGSRETATTWGSGETAGGP